MKYISLLFILTIVVYAQKINILDTKELNLKGVNELSALTYDGKILYALRSLSVLHHFKIELFNNKIKPDIIISDIIMSGLDGIQFFNKLKENRETESIPIIVVTAFTKDHSIRSLLNIGFNK